MIFDLQKRQHAVVSWCAQASTKEHHQLTRLEELLLKLSSNMAQVGDAHSAMADVGKFASQLATEPFLLDWAITGALGKSRDGGGLGEYVRTLASTDVPDHTPMAAFFKQKIHGHLLYWAVSMATTDELKIFRDVLQSIQTFDAERHKKTSPMAKWAANMSSSTSEGAIVTAAEKQRRNSTQLRRASSATILHNHMPNPKEFAVDLAC